MLLSACEELCNRALRYDESSRQAFAELEGKVLSVETYLDFPFGRPKFNFQIHFCENGLIFSALNDDDTYENSNVKIKASSFNLLSRLMSQKDLLDGEIDIQGERLLVSQLQSILFALDIDWEEPLSKLTGDVFAHEINRFAQDAKRFLRSSNGFFEKLLNKSIKFDAEIKTRNTAYGHQVVQAQENNFDTFSSDVAELVSLQEKLSLRTQKLLSKHKSPNVQISNRLDVNK